MGTLRRKWTPPLPWRRCFLLLFVLTLILPGAFFATTPFISHAVATIDGPTLTVDASADRHAISADIYGMNYADPALAQELGLPVNRWGGNATSRYNWQVDSSNSGSDWYFVGGKNSDTAVPGESADNFVTTNQSSGTKSLVTIPMAPYINKTSAKNCSYPSTLYPDQQSWEPYPGPNGSVCGNGKDSAGNWITDTDILLNNIPNSPEYQQQWIQHLITTHGTAAQGGVQLYDLDNEPSLWQYTHHDIHPNPTGYDELVQLSQSYAAMLKATDAGAQTLGPSDWGYTAYTTGIGAPGDDSQSHGGVGFGEYYLQQMHAYEQQYGVRLLDYFDEHYYPQASGIAFGAAGDADTQALRLRSTRSLWDPTYVDESWIGTYAPPIQLIPWFRGWINQNYPGTKLAITEYNWGALDSINGALTEADVLGIFGREQLDLATMWGPPSASQPGAYAFRIYLNYDGQGSRYGDTWIRSQSSDQGQLAIYGAQRSSDGALTLVIINKTGNDLTSSLSLAGAMPASTAQVYTYSEANLQAIVRQPDLTISNSGFSTTYPANSISMIVIPKQPPATPTPGITPTPTAGITPTPVLTPTPQPISCGVHYAVQAQWPGGFIATITITNRGSTPLKGWQLRFSFANGQKLLAGWLALWSQQGAQVTARDASFNASLPSNRAVTIGFVGTWKSQNAPPTTFTLNNAPCLTS